MAYLLRGPPEGELQRQDGDTAPRWVYIFNHCDGCYHPMRILLDTGSAANFIPRALVKELGLEPLSCTPREFTAIDGHQFRCKQNATVCWQGTEERVLYEADFYLLPSTSNLAEPLVGRLFINQFRHCLFDQDPARIAYTAQKPITVSSATSSSQRTTPDTVQAEEEREIRARRAELEARDRERAWEREKYDQKMKEKKRKEKKKRQK